MANGIYLFSPVHVLEIAFEEIQESATNKDMAAGIVIGLRAACVGYDSMLSAIDQEAARLAMVGEEKTTEKPQEKPQEKAPAIDEGKRRASAAALPRR
jgi:hypothetical protein